VSYRRNYSRSLHFSGSVNVSYPASERGGTTTAHWSHTEPISIDIDVDTVPFDSSIESCNGHVVALAGAVGLMNAAQCAAIEQRAAQISESLERGFFGMVRSELGSQMADLRNQFESKLALMTQQARTCRGLLDTMERDFQRIVSRYHDLFRNLDEENRRRVVELDRPAFRLSNEVGGNLLTRMRHTLAATNVTAASEGAEAQSTIVVAQVRSATLRMLETAKAHLLQERTVARSIAEIVHSIPVAKRRGVCLPVLITVAGDGELRLQTPPGLDAKFSGSVRDAIQRDHEQRGNWSWTPLPPAERTRIQAEVSNCLQRRFGEASSEADRRTAAWTAKLWQASAPLWLTATQKGDSQ